MSRLSTRRTAPALVPRVKVWLECDGRYAFGLGISEILRAVEETGSIKEAARRLDKSYRYIWGRIKAAERAISQQLVETHVGGRGTQRSNLTATARQLVADFLRLRQKLFETTEQEFTKRFRRPQATAN